MVYYNAAHLDPEGHFDPTNTASNTLYWIKEGEFKNGELQGYGRYVKSVPVEGGQSYICKAGYFDSGSPEYILGKGIIYIDEQPGVQGLFGGKSDKVVKE